MASRGDRCTNNRRVLRAFPLFRVITARLDTWGGLLDGGPYHYRHYALTPKKAKEKRTLVLSLVSPLVRPPRSCFVRNAPKVCSRLWASETPRMLAERQNHGREYLPRRLRQRPCSSIRSFAASTQPYKRLPQKRRNFLNASFSI